MKRMRMMRKMTMLRFMVAGVVGGGAGVQRRWWCEMGDWFDRCVEILDKC
jgi:hypothetical protein